MTTPRPDALTIMEPDRAWGSLETSTVGVVAFVHEDELHQIAINYTLIDRVVYLRISRESALGPLADGHAPVAFTVLYRASGLTQGWNVTVRGRTEEVTDPRARDAVLDVSGLTPWAGGERDVLIALHADRIDGRQAALRS